MELASRLLESCVDVFAGWALSGAGVVCLAVLWRRRGVRVTRLARSERGSYSISVLMALPTFVALLAMFVQCSCLILAKIGTVYAAYAAARSIAVWAPTDAAPEIVQSQLHRAAAKALAPLASGNAAHEEDAAAPCPPELAAAVASGYEAVASEAVAAADMVAQKTRNAYQATTIRLLDENGEPHASVADFIGSRSPHVSVELTYRAPLAVAGLGPLLGAKRAGREGDFYAREITTTVTLACDWSHVNKSHTPRRYQMGVRYDEIH